MRYLVLDDENIAAEYIARLICEVDKTGEVVTANNPIQALELAMQSNFDVCFIDIQMPGLNGVEFAEQIKKRYPKTNFIFVTGYLDYMGEAFKLDASDYLIKPTNVSQIRHALENLRYSVPVSSFREKKARIRITCFGNFEVLADGKPVKFKFDKTKELLAYLVHRKGARCTSKEIIAALWEEDGHDSYYRMLKKDLQDVFKQLECGEIIYSERGQIGMAHLDWIDCDYFQWLYDSVEGRKMYHGEYMAQYSWAEETNALIEMEKYQK
ncbi:response regulator [Fusobacterium necrophorum]|uniref:Hisitidine kinase n=1 Tax=Fusobacterium necrophorum DJ-2 TaxID=1441737 RepID=A0AB73C4J7_9FUSO|nr:response regulator [Fusobacterium necrophorum]KDE63732.1 hisitidine kinase [Fusobacterium necrophorum DJ-1]KDE72969.1 hisitidine kinase [Fusobacterium necrophorum DJ-2]MBR8822781.1 Protein-glutamate methylesterase/protein-glutamine glutaminase [Fusobacterium necrophorum]